jgi:hypothetical protein
MICLMHMLQPKKVYTYDASGLSAGDMSMKEISLPPGVYRVELLYHTESDGRIRTTLRDGSVFTGGLLTNGEFLYSGRDRTGFLVWLFESTDTLEIFIENFEGHMLQTQTLTFYETYQLFSMLLTILLFVCLLLFGVMYFRYVEQTRGISRSKKQVIFALFVITFAASLPYLLGVSLSGADLTYHLHRIDGVAHGLRSGQFPVRIFPQWPHDYGYADGIMYCNALLLVPAILRLLGFPITASYNLFGMFISLGTTWIAYHCFSRIYKSAAVGVICSALYTLSAFRLYTLLIPSRLGEGTAMMFMPLILYGFYRVFSEDPHSQSYATAWLPLTFGYAGLIQTHVLTCEITVLLTLITCLVFVKKIFCLKIFLALAKGALGALAISLWFLVPFIDYFFSENLLIRHVTGRTIQGKGLDVTQLIFHWWRTGYNGTQSTEPISMGWILILGFLAFGVFWAFGKWKAGSRSVIVMGKYCFLLGGLLMLFSLINFPWDRIQNIGSITDTLVGSLQYPYRFLGWGTLCLTAVFGCGLSFFQKNGLIRYYYTGVLLALIGLATYSVYYLDDINRNHNRNVLYNEEGMGMGYLAGAEYLVEGTDAAQLVYKAPETSSNVDLQFYENNYQQIQFSCLNDSEKEGYVSLPILLYTGYIAYDQHTNLELPIISGDNHTICVVIPPDFSGTVRVRFVPPGYWRVSEIISYMGWLFILLFYLGKGHLPWQNRKRVNV